MSRKIPNTDALAQYLKSNPQQQGPWDKSEPILITLCRKESVGEEGENTGEVDTPDREEGTGRTRGKRTGRRRRTH